MLRGGSLNPFRVEWGPEGPKDQNHPKLQSAKTMKNTLEIDVRLFSQDYQPAQQ
jgi:hypothetical protein